MQGIPVGREIGHVFLMGAAVFAEAALPGFEMDGQEHEQQERHGRLYGEQRERPERERDLMRGGQMFQPQGSQFISDRKQRQKPQNEDFLSGENPFRLDVQKKHEQGAQKQVNKNVVGDKPILRRTMDQVFQNGRAFSRLVE